MQKGCFVWLDTLTIYKYYVDKPSESFIENSFRGRKYKWLPLEITKPVINTQTHKYGNVAYTVFPDKVTKVYDFVEIPIADILSKKVKEGTALVDSLIKKEIDDYNEENFTDFKDENSLAKYVFSTTYSHYSFCKSMIDWIPVLWDSARDIELAVRNGEREEPTTEELLLELPKRV
ncbi:hypothetical protein TPMD03_53 [Thiohalocapsa phage LS06-2018-MD03]|nr:hypothetical protein TPMD03_53 [Thiohalocapsa phage LS06-2018-MD03]